MKRLKPYWLVTDLVSYADEAGVVTVGEIPAQTLIMSSCIVVSTLWTGTSPTLDLGDEDDADQLVDNTDVTATTANAYWGSATDAFEGAWYPAAKRIYLTIGGTSLTAGVAFGVLQCLDLSEYV